jgi:UDP-glucose 4-epimerase
VKILLTGSRGRLGPAIDRQLTAAGHQVMGFDLADGRDVRDAEAVRHAARECELIVHAAGLADDRGGHAAEIMAINLLGTWNVLLAAEAERMRRVVHFSSGKALGMLERDPDYLPLDDNHRGLPTRPYGLAKWLSEEMCQAFTTRTGIDTLCLRPVAVFDAAGYARAAAAPVTPIEPGKPWHMGVHIDLRDVASATLAAVNTSFRGHVRVLLCAADIADRRPTRELVAERLKHVPWRGTAAPADDPFRSLVDITHAQQVLGFSPRHRWPGRENQIG